MKNDLKRVNSVGRTIISGTRFWVRMALVFLITLCANVLFASQASELAESLVASYKFDNDTNSRVKDSAGSSDGEATNVEYVEGVLGKAASFNGVDSKIIIATDKGAKSSAIANLTTGSFACWIKFENRGGQVLPIFYLGKDDSSMPSRSMIFEIGHDRGNIENRRLYFTTIYAQKSNFCVDSGINLEPDIWYHYVAVVANGGNTIYLNGVELTSRRYNLGSTANCSVFFDDVPSKELLSIGYGRYSQEEPFFSFNGLIDEVMIYDRPLSAPEVRELFMAGALNVGDSQLGTVDDNGTGSRGSISHNKMRQSGSREQGSQREQSSQMRRVRMQ